ncbi:MAG TPA: transferrin receptor-like dimerization domain-containing protein [Steroidobacteraceae bacterium]|nr:transferrin receptor-like dimerization domain-containing protein [Steroidobacteraceae bacterium]
MSSSSVSTPSARRRRSGAALFTLVGLLALPVLEGHSASEASSARALLGYSVPASEQQRAWERRFREGINPANLRENLRRLSAHPHHVGSPYDKDNAEWILARYKEWGFDAHIESFDVLFPTPKVRLLEMREPTVYRATLAEPPIPEDPTSDQSAEQLPTYNAYSADGDVTGRLVYVNYGNRDDYEELDRRGISVKGAIVIARYGHGWRGVKPKVAAEHGAIGCIIYSDPQQDGFTQGDAYPKGGWRPREGVQRGSVMDTDYPGDPLTPGVGATAHAKRLALKDAPTIQKIPVLPVSYGDALPLLSALGGPDVPEAWRGGLNITYHIGPGPAVVHLVMQSNWDLKPVYDVIATLKGATHADQWVLRGNHHDAWVNGAEDPLAGQVALLEEARMLGMLHKAGWMPARTIIYCSWDGEEPGLLGSVEWVETHRADLQRHAVAYINSDTNERGFLLPGGTQDLETLISEVARDIEDPETHLSVFERSHLYSIGTAKDADERAEVRKRSDLEVTALGDGSDFTAFQDYAGIPTLDLEFGEENDGDQYHSIYDDFYWYTHFVDTDFLYGRALAQTAGTAIMRLADAEIIPLDYAPQADAIAKYEAELEKLLKDKQDEYTERNLEIDEGVYKALLDPRRPVGPPPVKAMPPFMNFAPMKNAIATLKKSADHYSSALAHLAAHDSEALPLAARERVNAALLRVSRLFLNEQGLPERSWFKNQIYAPGAYTGYDARPIAAVREYMDQEKWREADAQVPGVAEVIVRVASGIEAAAHELDRTLSGGS